MSNVNFHNLSALPEVVFLLEKENQVLDKRRINPSFALWLIPPITFE